MRHYFRNIFPIVFSNFIPIMFTSKNMFSFISS
ncbi:hypothetical protein S103564_2108 [Staphylococcus aureus subsp. aureus 103564]|nr:hypothetical protein S103564_2108 [Staphylococcus aureus subsp. aureus 103564]